MNLWGFVVKFYDFHIQGNNDYCDDLLLCEAKRLGFNGVCLFYKDDYFQHKNNLKHMLDDLNEDSNKENKNKHVFTAFSGLKIFPKNSEELRKIILKNYDKVDILMVVGGDLKINRVSCENPKIDILSRPYYKRKDSGINHVLAKEAARNNVTIELCLKDLIETKGYLRSKIISQFRDILKLSHKFNFNVIITTGAKTIYDLRTPHDILALIKSFGLTQDEAETALSLTPELIIKNSYEKRNIIINGVKQLT